MSKRNKIRPKIVKKMFFFSKVRNMPLEEEVKTAISTQKAETALKTEMKTPFADEIRNYLTDEIAP